MLADSISVRFFGLVRWELHNENVHNKDQQAEEVQTATVQESAIGKQLC